MEFQARLIQQYSIAFMSTGMTIQEATENARSMIAEAEQEVVRRGLADRIDNAGDWLLQQDKANEKVQNMLSQLRQDGCRDEDIRWWWNLPPLEQIMLEKMDDTHRLAGFVGLMRKGLSADQAAERVHQAHARFGFPSEENGEGRPLPWELKQRVVVGFEKGYLRMVDGMPLNAVIRKMMNAGQL